MDHTKIIELTWELVEEIKQGSEFLEYKEALSQLNSDEISSKLQTDFQLKKTDFEEVSRYGKHHPDFSKKASELSRAKAALYETDLYQIYLQKKWALDQRLESLSSAINKIIEPCLFDDDKSCRTG